MAKPMKVRHIETQQNQTENSTAWEYISVAGDAENYGLLNMYGADGWELVTVLRDAGTRVVYYFRRRRA
jgi:hypothetical protein